MQGCQRGVMPDLSQIASQIVWGQYLLMQERERLERAALFASGGWMALPVQVVVLGSPK